MSAARALAAWQGLNARQRAYLAAVFAIDRVNEAYERSARAAGGRRPPADEWRWLDYGEGWGGPSALLARLRVCGLAGAASARAPRRPVHAPARRRAAGGGGTCRRGASARSISSSPKRW